MSQHKKTPACRFESYPLPQLKNRVNKTHTSSNHNEFSNQRAKYCCPYCDKKYEIKTDGMRFVHKKDCCCGEKFLAITSYDWSNCRQGPPVVEIYVLYKEE